LDCSVIEMTATNPSSVSKINPMIVQRSFI